MNELIFAVETSCDETACALYDSERGIIAERIYSQWRRHAAYGGIVPEIASRDHLRKLLLLADDMLQQQRPTVIAYTHGPGLAGALLAGAATAQALAFAWQIPVVAVNHLEGHLLSPLLSAAGREESLFPYVALLASGGHTQLWLVRRRGCYRLLGETFDDAAGEAFDKTAVLLGLGYPGGARLEKLAATGNGEGIKLPSPAQNDFDFSFSGLKTAVRRLSHNHAAADVAAAFQQAAAQGMARQCSKALHHTTAGCLAVVGGVAQNAHVAACLRDVSKRHNAVFVQPHKRHCGDNAAMIAIAAMHQKRIAAGAFNVNPRAQPLQ